MKTVKNMILIMAVATLTVTCKEIKEKVKILSVAPATHSFAAAGEAKNVYITSAAWTATSSNTWLKVSSASGKGNAALTLTAAANSATSSRSATVTIKSEDKTATVTISQPATAAPTWIKVEKNKFIDRNGKEIIFRGLCYADPDEIERNRQWNERYFEEAKNWGANIVRFAVHPSAINRRGWDNYFTIVDRGIELAKKAGLLVIIDWHSMGNLKDEKFTDAKYNTTKEETFRFWTEVAKRYKNEPTVAMYELFNEPTVSSSANVGTCTWDEWKVIMENLIDTIRIYNPNALCLVAGFSWAYDLTPIRTAPINRKNIAYVSHPYPQKRSEPWEDKWEQDFGFVSDTYPVICTEIGYCLENEPGAHNPVISNDYYGECLMKYFESKGISFTVWCFYPSWHPMLFSDWNFTPTTQGRFFKNYLQKTARK